MPLHVQMFFLSHTNGEVSHCTVLCYVNFFLLIVVWYSSHICATTTFTSFLSHTNSKTSYKRVSGTRTQHYSLNSNQHLISTVSKVAQPPIWVFSEFRMCCTPMIQSKHNQQLSLPPRLWVTGVIINSPLSLFKIYTFLGMANQKLGPSLHLNSVNIVVVGWKILIFLVPLSTL